MSETWVNVYEAAVGLREHSSPSKAQGIALFWHDHIRVEHRINGHWHRPPVGMLGRDASHYRPYRFETREWDCGLIQFVNVVSDQLVKR